MTTPLARAYDQMGWRPDLVQSAVVEMVQNLFSNSTLVDPQLQNYSWTSDPATSNVKITTDGNFSLQDDDEDAKLVISAGDMGFMSPSLNSDLAAINPDRTSETRIFLGKVPVTIHCLSYPDKFAWKLAGEIGVRMRQNAKILTLYYAFKQLKVMGISKPKKQDEETYDSVVSLEATVQFASTLLSEDLPTGLQTSPYS